MSTCVDQLGLLVSGEHGDYLVDHTYSEEQLQALQEAATDVPPAAVPAADEPPAVRLVRKEKARDAAVAALEATSPRDWWVWLNGILVDQHDFLGTLGGDQGLLIGETEACHPAFMLPRIQAPDQI